MDDPTPKPKQLKLVRIEWISFYSAAVDVAKRLGVSHAEAERRIRLACVEERIRSMKAPFDGAPREEWEEIAPSKWSEREVDYDPPVVDDPDWTAKPVVMLNIDDLQHWLGTESKVLAAGLASSAKKQSRRSPKLDIAKAAIEALWPEGVPANLVSDDLKRKIGDYIKQQGWSKVSDDTMLRAAERKASRAPP